MNNQILKKIIILLIILLIIILIAVIITKLYLNKANQTYTENGTAGTNIFENYGKTSNGGVDSDAYFDIKKYMQKYLDTRNVNSLLYGHYDENGEYISTTSENEIKQKIYNLLSNKYISENNVTVENLYNHIDILEEGTIFVPVEMTLIQDSEIKSFLVYGLIESEENYSVIDKIFAVINIDMGGYKFSIEPIDGEYNSISEIEVGELEDTIIANENNEFFQAYITAEDIPSEYISIYKGLALGAPEKLYELLDEEYRNEKFGSIEEFKNYIEENKAQIITAQLQKYQVQVEGSKVRYICMDKKGNYYIINQNEALNDYTMILDAYTIDLPEFTEKYNNAKENEKVLLNIQKILDAIKMKDYKYVYSKLDDSFKSNYFKTEQDFEVYVKENWNESNTVAYGSYQKSGEVFVYDIEITEGSSETAEKINKKIVMKLLEGTDFVMSFNVE